METVQFHWRRIEDYLSNYAPHACQMLRPSVSETDIHQAEITLGIVFPKDFKASYRLHNGGYTINLVTEMQIRPLEKIVSDWLTFKELEEFGTWDDLIPYYFTEGIIHSGWQTGPIQPQWWHPKWLPFGMDRAGNFCCLDLAPAPGGIIGQIIDWDHETGPSHILTSSFLDLLSTFVSDLETGKYKDTLHGLEYSA